MYEIVQGVSPSHQVSAQYSKTFSNLSPGWVGRGAMATTAPLLGQQQKKGHSKASIFYGADEYLEDKTQKITQHQ